jgi:hypothetical protein
MSPIGPLDLEGIRSYVNIKKPFRSRCEYKKCYDLQWVN